MAKTVFILGAGASAEDGAPVMGNFIDSARDLYAEGRVAEFRRPHFERIFKAISSLKQVHSNSRLHIENIEILFAAYEMAELLGSKPGNDDPADVIAALKSVIAHTIEQTQRFHVRLDGGKSFLTSPVPYDNFVDLINRLRLESVPKHSVAILTFNYDIGLDFALTDAGIPLAYHLFPDNEGGALPLLKLHGSLNWGRYGQKIEIVSLPTNDGGDLITRQSREGPINFSVTDLLKKKRLDSEPVIVPPTWNKNEYHGTLTRVWKRAAKELADAENIFVVGYSMPASDSFFRHLYAIGTLGDSILRRFWVFNIDCALRDNFEHLLGPGAAHRFAFNPGLYTQELNGKFSSAIAYLMQEVFPKREGAS